MSTEWILRELYALWDKLKIVFSRLLDAPEILAFVRDFLAEGEKMLYDE